MRNWEFSTLAEYAFLICFHMILMKIKKKSSSRCLYVSDVSKHVGNYTTLFVTPQNKSTEVYPNQVLKFRSHEIFSYQVLFFL